MDHIRVIELLKKASKLTGIPASEIHTGKSTEAITFIRMVITKVLRDEGMRVDVIAEAFNRSTKSIYIWLDKMSPMGKNASFFHEHLLSDAPEIH